MIQILKESPLLLLVLVAGIGYPLGRIKVGGAALGVSAVLFVGLAFGALDPALKLPALVDQLGLAVFVYTVGLSSGPGFFASLRGRGLRDNLFVIAGIIFSALLCIPAQFLLGLRPGQTAGLFAGVQSNTPAMAGALDYLKQYAPGANPSDPVVAFSLTYPIGIIGMILTIGLAQKLFKPDYAREAEELNLGQSQELRSLTIRVTSPEAVGATLPALMQRHDWKVIFGRVKHGEHCEVATYSATLQAGDLITAVATATELDRVVPVLGEVSGEAADVDRSEVDMRRIFVSNAAVVGVPIRDLQLPQRLGAIITRVRRGDLDLLPHANMVLELGDRVRVLTRPANLPAVARYFGDSLKALSEIDITSFSLGLALGIILGMIPIPLPGGLTIKLGMAGGPLLVALVLGALVRTGRMVWGLPYNVNLVLRQAGLIGFSAGVGTRSGYDFAHTLLQGSGLSILGAGLVITCITGLTFLWVGHKLLKIPMGIMTGLTAGLHTQVATLSFAQEQAGNDLPNLGYTVVYPAAMVIKIVLAQVLLTLLL
ncbi:MAG TPA: aspartate:alanine exchanger family transporter [Symbiobacteriaceae bacterium]|nr:aspartate:alanine exchanger family transporter [Symbiobacteriaceae bacterium]